MGGGDIFRSPGEKGWNICMYTHTHTPTPSHPHPRPHPHHTTPHPSLLSAYAGRYIYIYICVEEHRKQSSCAKYGEKGEGEKSLICLIQYVYIHLRMGRAGRVGPHGHVCLGKCRLAYTKHTFPPKSTVSCKPNCTFLEISPKAHTPREHRAKCVRLPDPTHAGMKYPVRGHPSL